MNPLAVVGYLWQGVVAALTPHAEGESEGASLVNIWNTVAGWMRKTVSGEIVSPGRAMTLSTWFACIRNISEDVGKLPILVYKLNADGRGKTIDKASPLYWLLHHAPNPEMTASAFKSTVNGWAMSWGNGYAEIQRNAAGEPIALWPIHPSRARLHRVEGEIVLDVMLGGADDPVEQQQAVRLPYADVFHIRGFGDHPLVALSVAQLAAESIGLGLAAQTYGAAFFGNGAVPSILLKHPGKMDETGRTNLRESWKKRSSGARNAQGVAVLEEGITVEKLTIPPEDAQFLETRQFQIADIARWFRMPPHMVQDLSRSTFSNIEHQGIEYVTNTLTPWLVRWEEECERKLLRDRRAIEQYDVKFLVSALLRGDAKTRAEFYARMIAAGVMWPNEARIAEDLNPDPSPGADMLWMQGAMAPLHLLAKGDGLSGTKVEPAKDEPKAEPAETNDGKEPKS